MNSLTIRVFYREPTADLYPPICIRTIDKAQTAELAVSRLTLCRRAYDEVRVDRVLCERLGDICRAKINHWIGYDGIGVVHLENYAEFEIEPRVRDFPVEDSSESTQQLKRAVREATSEKQPIAKMIVPPGWQYCISNIVAPKLRYSLNTAAAQARHRFDELTINFEW